MQIAVRPKPVAAMLPTIPLSAVLDVTSVSYEACFRVRLIPKIAEIHLLQCVQELVIFGRECY